MCVFVCGVYLSDWSPRYEGESNAGFAILLSITDKQDDTVDTLNGAGVYRWIRLNVILQV